MLYSKEKILIQEVEHDVHLYLKRTRNHSYRITASKISLTLPNIYKLPETIEIHKSSLLSKVIERIEKQPELLVKTKLLDNDRIQIYTDNYDIIRNEEQKKFVFNTENKEIIFSQDEEKDKSKLIKKIGEHYNKFVDKRVRYINQITVKKNINLVELKNNHSTWGLCSTRGEITISINTLFAPIWVLNYVIVHELCHLVHHDHSVKFWTLVERFYPKYKEAKKYLKENGMGLVL